MMKTTRITTKYVQNESRIYWNYSNVSKYNDDDDLFVVEKTTHNLCGKMYLLYAIHEYKSKASATARQLD